MLRPSALLGLRLAGPGHPADNLRLLARVHAVDPGSRGHACAADEQRPVAREFVLHVSQRGVHRLTRLGT